MLRALRVPVCAAALAVAGCEEQLQWTDFLEPSRDEAARHGIYYHEKSEDESRRYYFAQCYDRRSSIPPAVEREMAIACMRRMGFTYIGRR